MTKTLLAASFCLWAASTLTASSSLSGIVIEELGRGLLPEILPLRPGDAVVAWAQGTEGGDVRSPFDMRTIAVERLPRGAVDLHLTRDGSPLTVTVPPAAWSFDIEVRPAFAAATLALYEQGRALVKEKTTEEGTRLWREAAVAVESSDRVAACWLHVQRGRAWAEAERRPEFLAAFQDATTCAAALPQDVRQAVRAEQGRTALSHRWVDVAEQVFTEMLTTPDGMGPLMTAQLQAELGVTHYLQGRHDDAIASLRTAVATCEATVPESLVLAQALLDLATCHSAQGSKAEADAMYARAEQLSARIAPRSQAHLRSLLRLGSSVSMTGDLIGAERFWKRGLELAPEDADEKTSLVGSLGALAYVRGDMTGAEALTRQAMERARRADDRGNQAVLLGNLGTVALAKGDVTGAERLLSEALERERLASVNPHVMTLHLRTMGDVRRRLGDLVGAKEYFEQSLKVSDTTGGHASLVTLASLGELARAKSDWPAAEAAYRRGLAFLTRPDPIGPREAQILHGLGMVARARGEVEEAADRFGQAVAAIERVRGRVGGTDEARSVFASRHFGIYHDHAGQLVRLGRTADAYDVLELSRARSLLALLAERDVIVQDGIPAELEQQRRRVDAEYQQGHRALLRLDPVKDHAKVDAAAVALAALRQKQNEVAEKIREVAPRLADLRYPEPLSTRDVQAALEPGTLLLAFSTGDEDTLLFAVTHETLDAVRIPLAEADLRRRIDHWRGLAERSVPLPAFYKEARDLYEVLLRPVDRHLLGARHVLVSPGGSLHALPFPALRRGERYVADWKPLTIVPSGTLYAQWESSRRQAWAGCDVVGFADPRRPAAGFDTLPESRRELQTVVRLCPKAARLHVGDAATEEQAKGLGKEARYIHFACHGLVDERLPLDSGLVLHAPGGAASEDDGLLQAWEIYERVRIDADLVTLSACDSGSGAVRAGEGLLGLTRAFHYAGARSVLASLWSVGDKSSAWFMERFYGELARGATKDEALQRTQQAAIRAGRRPSAWAAYQLYGDWR